MGMTGPVGWPRPWRNAPIRSQIVWLRVLFMGLLSVLPLGAEGWRRPFTLLGPDQGLPAGSITGLAQDSEGFLWVATESGLLRYEGTRCRKWDKEDGLPSGFISRVLPASGGGVWAATLKGLIRLREGRVEVARSAMDGVILIPEALAQDALGRLWIVTREGLFVQSEGLQFDRRMARPEGRIFALTQGRAGTMHLGTEAGLQTFLPDGSTREWGPAQGLPAAGVAMVVEDGEGRVWAGSGRTLAVKHPEGSRFTDASAHLGASLSPNSLPFLDQDGSVWLPTQAGAVHLKGERSERIEGSGGLPFHWVRTVLRDREGTLWVLGSALARLQGGDRVWNHSLGPRTSGGMVWSIIPDGRGAFLVGTDDGALRVTPQAVTRIHGTEGYRIKYLAMDRRGTLWMVNTMGPTLWLRPGARKAEVAPLGELGFGLNHVLEDSHGRIWLGHVRKGILRWDPVAKRVIQEAGPAAPGALGVFRIREDAKGRLWAASTAGLHIKEPGGAWRLFTEQQGLRASTLLGMAFMPDGTAWIHYLESEGLSRVRVEGDRLTILEHRKKGQGLQSNQIYAVEVDGRGGVWASTDQGLDRLDPHLHLGRRDGMVSEDCSLQGLFAEGDRIWVGTSAGLVRYEAGGGDTPAVPLRPHVVEITYGNRHLEPPFGTLPPLSHGEATVAFRIAAPAYRDTASLRFQVRLLGLEDSWRDADSTQVRYPALPGGRYRFEVRIAEGEGAFGPTTGIDLVVRPPWWRTWWALGIEGLALLGLGLTILRLRVASLARSKAELEALVAQRTKELQARNEDLSVALSHVKQLSGLLPICASCKKIRDDKGYWNQLEHYFYEHTHVEFTHGICPGCADMLYPGMAKHRQAMDGDLEDGKEP